MRVFLVFGCLYVLLVFSFFLFGFTGVGYWGWDFFAWHSVGCVLVGEDERW